MKHKLSSPPTLAVVAENPRIPHRPRRATDDKPMILPAVDLFRRDWHAFMYEAMGPTEWQVNRAWQLVSGTSGKKYEGYIHATSRTFYVRQALEAALDQERREILAILQEHHPAVARKIMKGLQPKA